MTGKRYRREISKKAIEEVNKKTKSDESFKEALDRILGIKTIGSIYRHKKKLQLTIN